MDPQIHSYMRRYHSTRPNLRHAPGRDARRPGVANVRYPEPRSED